MEGTPNQDLGVAEGAAEDGSVDLEALINAFVQDESSESLELPRSLTAEQRKQAKRLADQRPELKCESYGFGEERRLHLFKKKDQDRVRVKNTFIDDWEGAGGEREPAVFRSMPAHAPIDLLERTLQRCMEDGGLDAQGMARKEDSSVAGSGSPRSSTAGGTDVGQLGNSPSPNAPELPPLPEGFKVRNTFIHIESVPVVERIVQSMPHGMFRQCLEAELSAQNPDMAEEPAGLAPPRVAAAPAPEAEAPTQFPADQPIMPGTEVIIQNLIKLPDFNGLTGVVQSLDAESGRYDVLLDGPAGTCGWRWVKVKGENCRPCMPPPPPNAPSISLDCMPEGEGEARTDVPPTPKWEEDYSCQGVGDQKSSATPLKLNALV
mmetsp:Transcript_134067/g.286650  ORF Transcript_134067/g.286650 Transcript_134067/m.286650 type:complete len:377 (-) Transcript_134067:100-1230(-)